MMPQLINQAYAHLVLPSHSTHRWAAASFARDPATLPVRARHTSALNSLCFWSIKSVTFMACTCTLYASIVSKPVILYISRRGPTHGNAHDIALLHLVLQRPLWFPLLTDKTTRSSPPRPYASRVHRRRFLDQATSSSCLASTATPVRIVVRCY